MARKTHSKSFVAMTNLDASALIDTIKAIKAGNST
jgi:hypothetical protein